VPPFQVSLMKICGSRFYPGSTNTVLSWHYGLVRLLIRENVHSCILILHISHVSVVMNSLRHLSKTTDILTDPSRLPDEATRAVCSADGSVTSSTSRSSATSTVT
jgi:hypothetical protein